MFVAALLLDLWVLASHLDYLPIRRAVVFALTVENAQLDLIPHLEPPMQSYEEVNRHWQETLDNRARIDELLRLEQARADKVHTAFQQIVQDHRAVCAERDQLKQALATDTSTALSSSSRSLQEELDHVKEELSRAQQDNLALKTLISAHEEERQNWRKFRQWWDDALNAKKERKSSTKKPKLTNAERLLISHAGLTTPVPAKLAHPRAQALSGAAQTGTEQENAADPLTPITRPPHSLLSTDAARMREWLDHVDRHPTTSSVTERQEADTTTTGSSAHTPRQKHTADSALRTRESAGSNKRRRLACSSQDDDVAAVERTDRRTPLRDLSPNSVDNTSHSGGRSVVKIEVDASPQQRQLPPPPASKARPRGVTPIKAESDDEGARDCAMARTSQSFPARELTRAELREKRKAEMEDLKRNPWKYRGRGRYAAELQR